MNIKIYIDENFRENTLRHITLASQQDSTGGFSISLSEITSFPPVDYDINKQGEIK